MSHMPNTEIEEFARLLIQEVRDVAIRACEARLNPETRSAVALRWKRPGTTVYDVLPDCIDEALAQLLIAIDQGAIRLRFIANDGRAIDLTDEGLGELAGWYMGSDGWRAKYSNERYVDDFADLNEPGRGLKE